jgi:hypothetical protein
MSRCSSELEALLSARASARATAACAQQVTATMLQAKTVARVHRFMASP